MPVMINDQQRTEVPGLAWSPPSCQAHSQPTSSAYAHDTGHLDLIMAPFPSACPYKKMAAKSYEEKLRSGFLRIYTAFSSSLSGNKGVATKEDHN